MQSPLKSSFLDKKKYGHAGQKVNLMFTPTEQLSISDRDYGLMKSSVGISTPYPHMDEGVDAEVLKARLSMRHNIEIKRRSSLSDMSGTEFESVTTIKSTKSPSKFVNVDRKLTITPSFDKNALSLGTPHPKKGVALNASVLAKRLLDVNEELSTINLPKVASRSRIARKKVVRLREFPTVGHQDLTLDGEQLSNISQRLSDNSFSVSQLSLKSVKDSLDFAERRKRLEEGEFTIARYGKKMGDVIMASTPLQHMVVDHSRSTVKKAKEEFDRYTQSQGLTKERREQLSWKSEFTWLSSAGSTDTLYPKTASMTDIYRDIKIRQYVRSQTQHGTTHSSYSSYSPH